MGAKFIRQVRFIFLLFLVMSVLSARTRADDPQSAFKTGPFAVGTTLSLSEGLYLNTGQTGPVTNWSGITDRAIRNSVSLKVDESSLINYNIDYTLTLKIDYYINGHSDGTATMVSETKDLHISYYYAPNNTAHLKSQLNDTYYFNDAYKIVVTVLAVNTHGLPTPSDPHIKLSSSITIDRQYLFQPQLQVGPTVALINNGSQANVSWGYPSGAEQYDLEWTIINDGNEHYSDVDNYVSSNAFIPADILNLVFRNNASRMTTDAHALKIPVICNDETSYLLVRIRQTQYRDGVRLLGAWDYTDPLTSKYAIVKLNWNQSNLNWQFSAAYAEDGKNKAVMSYFDGTLRNRQTVTINNTDQVAVAQENVYDQFGRAVASILPAPNLEPSPSLDFIPKFNRNSAGDIYSLQDLQIPANIVGLCNINPEALSTSSGSSRYYSSLSDFINDRPYNQYIPDAKGYPLSVTQYTDDNTGRIKLQGGVGDVFQPGGVSSLANQSNKSTKYFYAKPEQWELDQLFGNDAGYAEHYLKNMVVDPNGQASVSYLNASGKTIATALAGNEPGNLDKIESLRLLNTGNQQSSQILKPEQFVYNSTDMKFTASTTYLATSTGTNTLYFNIKKLIDEHTSTSNPSFHLCSNCYYELKISITNACGDELVQFRPGQPGYDPSSKILKIGSAIENCGDGGMSLTPITAVFGDLGEYHIQIELAFNKAVVEQFVNNYMSQGLANNIILQKLDYVQQYYLNSLDASGCYSDCKTCSVLLGTQTSFVQMVAGKFNDMDIDQSYTNGMVFQSWAQGLYQRLKTKCTALESSCKSTICDAAYADMLGDVSPGGQYALFNSDGVPTEPSANAITRITDGIINWRRIFPVKGNTDPDYQQNLITLTDGSTISPNDAAFTVRQLITYWKQEWADRFVIFHPEYCRYKFCQDMSGFTTWDYVAKAIVNKASDVNQITGGVGVNASSAGLNYSYSNNADWLLGADPFFKSGGDGHGYFTQMQEDLNHYSQSILHIPAVDDNGNTIAVQGLMAYIDNLVYCTDANGVAPADWRSCAPTATCRVADKEWAAYRQIYFELKQKYYDLLRASRCPHCTIGQPLAVTIPGATPVTSDFTLKELRVADADGSNTLLVYNPGNIQQTVTVHLYYPSGSATGSTLTSALVFQPGDSQKKFFIPNSIALADVHVQVIQPGLPQPTVALPTVYVDDQFYVSYDSNCDASLYSGFYGSYVRANKTVAHLSAGYSTDHDITVRVNYTGWLASNSFPLSVDLVIPAGQFESQPFVHNSTPDYVSSTCSDSYFEINCLENISGGLLEPGSSYSMCGPVTPPATTYTPSPTDSCSIFAVKIARFPDAPTFDASTLNGQTKSSLIAMNADLIRQQASEKIAGQVDAWISALSLDNDPHKNQVKAALTEVALADADETHADGASVLTTKQSVNPAGANYNPKAPPAQSVNGYTSFADVIIKIFHPGVNTFTLDLNPWLIDGPYPYESRRQAVNIVSEKNADLCTRISSLQTKATAAGKTLFNYLTDTFKGDMTISAADLTMLQDACATSSCTNKLPHDVTLPTFMDPEFTEAITASAYLSAKNDMLSSFSPALMQSGAKYQVILTNFMNYRLGYSLGFNDYDEYDKLVNNNANSAEVLRNSSLQSSLTVDPNACIKSLIETAIVNGQKTYEDYLIAERERFRNEYLSLCKLANPSLNMNTSNKMYHYTLYYYDQADNLVRTVPPEGVHLIPADALANVSLARQGIIAGLPGASSSRPVTDKAGAFQSLSNTLGRTAASAIETWLFNAGSGINHLAEATTDHQWLYQLTISGSDLGIDIYPMSPATTSVSLNGTSQHYRVSIPSTSLPLSQWTHVVVQSGFGFSQGHIPDIYLNGTQMTVTASTVPLGNWSITATTTSVTYPDDIASLRYLLFYNRLMTKDEIITNSQNASFAPLNSDNSWYSFNTPGTNNGIYATTSGFYPIHTLTTNYAYNSTNQVVKQYSPDGDVNNFWYDILGRLTVSQNQKQAAAQNYSYTNYDVLGRITEVGQTHTDTGVLDSLQMMDEAGNPFYLPAYMQPDNIDAFKATGMKEQITHTYYDEAAPTGNGIQSMVQENLRKRVAASTYQPTAAGAVEQATYYNYDIDGNVKTLYQQLAGLDTKRIDYEYDLVSGKVNFVRYQHGHNDQFYYQYDYDAENRLIKAWSGTLAMVEPDNGSKLLLDNKRLDAGYFYYLHGPLARVELGDEHRLVQGVDYAYTLQGWLKGVNSTALDPALDMGSDGKPGNMNVNFGRDVYGYALHYYNNDYRPIGATNSLLNTPNPFADGSVGPGFRALFNGNIAASSVNINLKGTEEYKKPLLYVYSYDQLNRITRQDAFKGLSANTWVPTRIDAAGTNAKSDYHEDVTYDANGNIASYNRRGFSPGTTGSNDMDVLSYGYNTDANFNKLNNRLRFVNDGVSASNYNNADLKDQNNTLSQAKSADNYQYDAIGNLQEDRAADIRKNPADGTPGIEWTVYGKIKAIHKFNPGGLALANISYSYDIAGHRVSKTVGTTTTWYVRDAQGNPLALYDNAGNTVNWKEQQLYGSSRLGMWMPEVSDLNGEYVVNNAANKWNTAGNKVYELSNHLGNVMATVSDARVQVEDNGSTFHFEADMATAQDYYPFGMPMPGRNFIADNTAYRYGFNGKENDNEVKGTGNEQDYGMRIYDPRVGRFLSVDPITIKYPMLTPYQFASNSSISGIDLDGLEYYWSGNGTYLGHLNNSTDVYTATEIKDGVAINSQSLNVKYSNFIKNASVVYGESSHEDWEEANAIAGIYISGRNTMAYAIKDPSAKKFRAKSDLLRNKDQGMKQAISATIGYYNGTDNSNGADAWDGAEQALFGEKDNRRSTGKYELHMNTMGWDIDDDDYADWKASIGTKFKAPQKKYAPDNYKYNRGKHTITYNNKDKITLKSVAQFGKTIFWKTLKGKNIEKKPKETTTEK